MKTFELHAPTIAVTDFFDFFLIVRFESTLQGIAECLYRERNLPLSPKDLTGTGIHQAQKYLIKVAQVPFPEHEAFWQDITAVSKIRNIVVHRNGFLMDAPKGDSKTRLS